MQESVRVRLSKEQIRAWRDAARGPVSTWVREVVCQAIGREDLLLETEATRAGRVLQSIRAERVRRWSD